jgi:hypothetical protein
MDCDHAWRSVGDHLRLDSGVVDHLYGRFCRREPTPTARRPYRDACSSQVTADSLTPDMYGRFDPPYGPAKWPNAITCCFFCSRHCSRRRSVCPATDSMSSTNLIGRFSSDHVWPVWVFTEAQEAIVSRIILGNQRPPCAQLFVSSSPTVHTSVNGQRVAQ